LGRRDFLLGLRALQVGFTEYLSQHLGLPWTLLVATGDFLSLYGAAVAFLASRTRVSSAIIWLLIVGNFLWGQTTCSRDPMQ
jgi:hypothetical protein